MCNFHVLYMSTVWCILSAHFWYTHVLYFFHLCYVYCLKQLFMYFMSIYWCILTWQMIMQELFIDIHIFHDVVTFIWIFSFLMRIVLYIVYFYISYTVTLTYHILGTHILNNNIPHYFLSHTIYTVLMYWRCFRTVCYYLSHSLLLKLYM